MVLSGGLGISCTTDAISSTNGGSATLAGGLAVAKKVFIGASRTDIPNTASGNTLILPSTTFTDSSTSGAGTLSNWYGTYFGKNTLSAINSLVTTTNAATVYIDGAVVPGTNETITNNYALYVGSGTVQVQDHLKVGSSTLDVNNSTNKVLVNSVDITPSTGDIQAEMTFSAGNNVTSPANVTGFAFGNGIVRSFKAIVSVSLVATSNLYETFELLGIQTASGWSLSSGSLGDKSDIKFTITSSGQVQYTSGNKSGFVSNTIKFRATTTSI
jgi:hypothetical protein